MLSIMKSDVTSGTVNDLGLQAHYLSSCNKVINIKGVPGVLLIVTVCDGGESKIDVICIVIYEWPNIEPGICIVLAPDPTTQLQMDYITAMHQLLTRSGDTIHPAAVSVGSGAETSFCTVMKQTIKNCQQFCFCPITVRMDGHRIVLIGFCPTTISTPGRLMGQFPIPVFIISARTIKI